MVRVKIVHAPQGSADPRTVSAQLTAAAVKQEMVSLLGATGIRKLDPNHIVVVLQDFGDWNYGGETRFFSSEDRVQNLPLGENGNVNWPDPSSASAVDYLQPWMQHGKEGPRAWMIAFVAELRALCQMGDFAGVFPRRFEFDTEFALARPGDPNLVFLLRNLAMDPRWGQTSVPGHNGATMATMWQAARNLYSIPFDFNNETIYPGVGRANPWAAESGPTSLMFVQPGTNFPKGFEFETNRDVYLWYSAICQRVVDWLMDYAAYQPLQGLVPAGSGLPPVICSNYGDVAMSGSAFIAEWSYDVPGPVPFQSCGSQPFVRQWSRATIAGIPDAMQHGMIDQPLSSGSWLVSGRTHASSGWGAPVLYLAGDQKLLPPCESGEFDRRAVNPYTDHVSADAYRQYDVYRKPGLNGLRPRETWWQASLRQHERVLDAAAAEAILSGRYDQSTFAMHLSPWLISPYGLRLFNWNPEEQPVPLAMAYMTMEDAADQLWLMRRKRIGYIKYWDANGFDPLWTIGPWAAIARCYERVYMPELAQYVTIEHGTTSNTSAEQLEDDLPRPVGQSSLLIPYALAVESAGVSVQHGNAIDYAEIASFHVDAQNVEAGRGLKLRLETQVDRQVVYEDDPMAWPLVRIYFWRWASQQWVLMNIPAASEDCSDHGADDLGVLNGPYMTYNAPCDDPGCVRTSLRRNCHWSPDQCSGFVELSTGNVGRVRVKVVHQNLQRFTVNVDLLQLMATDETSGNVGVAGQPVQGADLNYDEVISAEDVGVFLGAFASEAPLADMNGDDVVMADDVAVFAELWSEGVP